MPFKTLIRIGLAAAAATSTCSAATLSIPHQARDVVSPRSAADSTGHSRFLSFPITKKRQSRPLRMRKREDDTNVPLFNESSISYLIELSIGTQGQPVKVAIDTGSDELWVNPECNNADLSPEDANRCEVDGQYNPDASSTAKESTLNTTIQYGIGSVEMQYFSDHFSLPNSDIAMTDVIFGVATNTQDLSEGILGLGFGNGKNLDYNNFVDNLFVQNITNSRAFSVALGSIDADNGGVLIFGGVDTGKFAGSLIAHDILGRQSDESLYRYWVQMAALTLTDSQGNNKTYPNSDMPIVVDSGSSLSYFPDDIISAMAADFGARLDSDSGLYLVSCSVRNQDGYLGFRFGSQIIRVPFNEFIWEPADGYCALGASSAGNSALGSVSLLGDTFLRSAYVVFDQTNEKISMAQYSNCGQNEQLIPTSGAEFDGECNPAEAAEVGNSNSAAALTWSRRRWDVFAVAGLVAALVMI